MIRSIRGPESYTNLAQLLEEERLSERRLKSAEEQLAFASARYKAVLSASFGFAKSGLSGRSKQKSSP